MNNFELAAKCKAIALHYKTLYVLGGIGFPLTASMKKRSMQQYSYNAKRRKMIEAASADTFGFDCVGLIKSGCFWGWNGDVNAIYGGAKNQSKSVSDTEIEYAEPQSSYYVELPFGNYMNNIYAIINPSELRATKGVKL